MNSRWEETRSMEVSARSHELSPTIIATAPNASAPTEFTLTSRAAPLSAPLEPISKQLPLELRREQQCASLHELLKGKPVSLHAALCRQNETVASSLLRPPSLEEVCTVSDDSDVDEEEEDSPTK